MSLLFQSTFLKWAYHDARAHNEKESKIAPIYVRLVKKAWTQGLWGLLCSHEQSRFPWVWPPTLGYFRHRKFKANLALDPTTAPHTTSCISVNIASKAKGSWVCGSFGRRLWHGGRGFVWAREKKTTKIEGEKEGKPQQRICNSSWCFPSFGWLLTVRQAVPHRALVFPLGPPSRPRGEVENCNPTPSKCSLLNTHVHTRTNTHMQQLSTGKAGDRMRSPFTAALVRRGVQMGSCYTLIVG